MTIDTPHSAGDPIPHRRRRIGARFARRPGLAAAGRVGAGVGKSLSGSLSNGRLVPPPTKVFATIMELARSGELSPTSWRR